MKTEEQMKKFYAKTYTIVLVFVLLGVYFIIPFLLFKFCGEIKCNDSYSICIFIIFYLLVALLVTGLFLNGIHSDYKDYLDLKLNDLIKTNIESFFNEQQNISRIVSNVVTNDFIERVNKRSDEDLENMITAKITTECKEKFEEIENRIKESLQIEETNRRYKLAETIIKTAYEKGCDKLDIENVINMLTNDSKRDSDRFRHYCCRPRRRRY